MSAFLSPGGGGGDTEKEVASKKDEPPRCGSAAGQFAWFGGRDCWIEHAPYWKRPLAEAPLEWYRRLAELARLQSRFNVQNSERRV